MVHKHVPTEIELYERGHRLEAGQHLEAVVRHGQRHRPRLGVQQREPGEVVVAEDEVRQFRQRVEPIYLVQLVVCEVEALEVRRESGEQRRLSQLGHLVVAERKFLQFRPPLGARLVSEAFGEDVVKRDVAAVRDTEGFELASQFGEAAEDIEWETTKAEAPAVRKARYVDRQEGCKRVFGRKPAK